MLKTKNENCSLALFIYFLLKLLYTFTLIISWYLLKSATKKHTRHLTLQNILLKPYFPYMLSVLYLYEYYLTVLELFCTHDIFCVSVSPGSRIFPLLLSVI